MSVSYTRYNNEMELEPGKNILYDVCVCITHSDTGIKHADFIST